MTAKIITVTSLKGGVGKTTSSYALCAAAISLGKKVIAIDLDPTGGLSNTLARSTGMQRTTIADVFAGRISLQDALTAHPLGQGLEGVGQIRSVPSSRSLNEMGISEAWLRKALDPVMEEADYIIIDTQPFEPALHGPLMVADMVVIPTALDLLSLKAAVLTVGLAQELECVHKLKGILISNAKRPLSKIAAQLRDGLTILNLNFDTVLFYAEGWVRATSGSGLFPDPPLLAEAQNLFNEVLNRDAPIESWVKFVSLAKAKKRTI